jgi:hypothetical protein
MSRAVPPRGDRPAGPRPPRSRFTPIRNRTAPGPVRTAARVQIRGRVTLSSVARESQFIMAIMMIRTVAEVLVAGTTWHRVRKGESA